MDFSSYQKATNKTAIYPRDNALAYLALAVNGEAGEIAEQVKKAIRDDGARDAADVSGSRRELIGYEIGDVLWYLSELATSLGYSLDHLAQANLDKLNDRQARGVLGGSGDTR